MLATALVFHADQACSSWLVSGDRAGDCGRGSFPKGGEAAAPAAPQGAAPQAISVSRGAGAHGPVTSQVLYFHNATLRYAAASVSLPPCFACARHIRGFRHVRGIHGMCRNHGTHGTRDTHTSQRETPLTLHSASTMGQDFWGRRNCSDVPGPPSARRRSAVLPSTTGSWPARAAHSVHQTAR